MSLDTAIRTLKAAGDPTRARLLALLSVGEATVGELQRILEQSQPRVSRHLRLLGEAGLVTKFRDGQWVYYRVAADPVAQALVTQVIQLAGSTDPVIERDAAALTSLKRERERDAWSSQVAAGAPASVYATARPDSAELAAAVVELLAGDDNGDVLNVGCGAGNLLVSLGEHARRVVGVDNSKRMRLLARSRVHRAGIATCTVRNGDLRELPFDDESFDVVVLDEVLGGSADRLAGLGEAHRVLRVGGRLIIADRLQPVARKLTSSDESLIENQLTAQLTELGFRTVTRSWLPGRALEYALLLAVKEAGIKRTGTHG